MSNLHRTQIYIDEEQIRQLKIEAEKERLAVSELIRRAIRRLLDAKTKSIDWNNDSLTHAVGKVKLVVKDASANHDRYVYGLKKRE